MFGLRPVWLVGAGSLLLLASACSDTDNPIDPVGGGGGSALSGGQTGSGATAASGGSGADSSSGGNVGSGSSDAMSGGAGPGAGGLVQSTGGEQGSDEEYPVPDSLEDESGAELWLRYRKVPIPIRLGQYQAAFTHVVVSADLSPSAAASATFDVAQDELVAGLSGLTGMAVTAADAVTGAGAVIIGTPSSSSAIAALALPNLPSVGDEGYLVQSAMIDGQSVTVVVGNTAIGALYGSFALLRHLQSHSSIADLSLSGAPKIKYRMLNHWDNLDRSVERGYAGQSLWNWNSLPGTISPRYIDYARANASVGINSVVLTNVNATKNNNEDMWNMRDTYFPKVKALADAFRPYGIRVYLTAPFNAGGTANPNDAATRKWWVDRMNEIYAQIPDFGGLLIKASSEGEPGPSNGASHADGANMLATAIGDRGIVVWRAFVYGSVASDRVAQAYDQFQPLDGDFESNVFVQPKNGALDFQPREPFHPLFGAMPQTPLALELQITKEYLGQNTHLAYLGTMWEEVLQADTHADGAGSTVARVIDGSLHNHSISAIAGVANIGDDTNWSGSHFNQANWYAYGRLAWDPDASAEAIAEEWVRQTLSCDPVVVAPVVDMMMQSREHVVDYMTPLGLVHLMATDHHYGPGPWVNDLSTAEWNPAYYHDADAQGIGFDRTSTGSNAVRQYFSPVREEFSSRDTVPDEFLLFFHHVGWQEELSSGRTVWEELVHRYSRGVDGVDAMKKEWVKVESRVDANRYAEVSEFLNIQHYEARWWRDASLAYFGSVASLEIPSGYSPLQNSLSFYRDLTCPPNLTKPRCSPIETGNPSPAILP